MFGRKSPRNHRRWHRSSHQTLKHQRLQIVRRLGSIGGNDAGGSISDAAQPAAAQDVLFGRRRGFTPPKESFVCTDLSTRSLVGYCCVKMITNVEAFSRTTCECFLVLTPLMPAPTAWFHWVEAFKALPEPVWIGGKSDASASFIAGKLFIAHKGCRQRNFFAETSSIFPLQRTLTGPAILFQDGWVGIPSEMFSPPAASLDWPRYVIISLNRRAIKIKV